MDLYVFAHAFGWTARDVEDLEIVERNWLINRLADDHRRAEARRKMRGR